MIVVVSRTFPAELRGEIERLVSRGFDGVDAHDVEVHVKARARTKRVYVAEVRRRSRWVRVGYERKRDALDAAARHGGSVETVVSRPAQAGWWSGRAYDGVPSIARVEPGVAYLVTLNIPADPRRLTRYPVRQQDPRLKTGPEVLLESWRDELLHISAHEARHIHQFRHRLRRSELDAERWAAAALDRYQELRRPLTLFDVV